MSLTPDLEVSWSDYHQKISSYISNPTATKTPIECWDTKDLTTLNSAFYLKKSFNGDISCWNVSHAPNMKVSDVKLFVNLMCLHS